MYEIRASAPSIHTSSKHLQPKINSTKTKQNHLKEAAAGDRYGDSNVPAVREQS